MALSESIASSERREETRTAEEQNRLNRELLVAVREGQADATCSLLERGADIKTKDQPYGRTPLHWAADYDPSDIVRLLLERGAEIEPKDGNQQMPMHLAASKGDSDTVRLLVEHGAGVEPRDVLGETPLHKAAENGHSDTVRLLLERGADIEAKSRAGRTPLHHVSNLDTVRLLLDRGADIEAKVTESGHTPLHTAASDGHSEVFHLLVERGADIDAKDNNGKTVLHSAALKGKANSVRVALEHGADIHAKDKDGQTPLSLAIQALFRHNPKHRYDTAKTLCDSGARWDESCNRDDPEAEEIGLTVAAGLRACVRHWTRQRELDSMAALTEIPIENVEGGKESVATYLESIAKTSAQEIVRRRKLCVVGASCSGKTSLVKSLENSKTVLVEEEDRTIGIDLFELNWQSANSLSGKYEATIWDFAGQDVYQVAHSLYFSKRTLYLVFVNLETYDEQLQLDDGDDMKKSEARLDRWVRDNIFCWVQLVLGRQPDAELVLVCSKSDKVDGPTADTIVKDLEDRLTAWSTDFVNDHVGPIQLELQRSVEEFTHRDRLQVSIVSQDTVEMARRDVQDAVTEKPERAYLMPKVFTDVLQAVYAIQQAAAASTSVADRVEKLLVEPEQLIEDLLGKIDGLKRRECRDILGTLHALGDILWFDQERHLSSAGASSIVLDPRIMLDLVREVVNHELEDRDGEEYDVLRARGELKHSLLSTFPLWRALCEQSPERVRYFKRQLQRFNLAYPVGNEAMAWDSDLIVPSYWKTKKQPASVDDGVACDAFSSEAVWRYTVPTDVSETIFDQFVVQSHDVEYDRSVTSTAVVMNKADVCSASIVYSEGAKPSEDVILIRVQAESIDACWRTMELLVVSMERVLDGYPGLGTVRRHVLRKNGRKTAEYDVRRFIKSEECDAVCMVEAVKAVFCRPSVGA